MRLPRKNWLEWLVFAVAAVLVLGTLGFLTYEVVVIDRRPPAIEATLGRAMPQHHGFAIPVRVENRGDRSADEVKVEVTVYRGATQERAELSVGLLPRRSQRDGWVLVPSDPGTADSVTARAAAYRDP